MDERLLGALDEVRTAPGVSAAWVSRTAGGPIIGTPPRGCSAADLGSVAAAAQRLLGVSGGPVEMEFETGTLRAELVDDLLLQILTTPDADQAWVRLSCEVTRARLREARVEEGRGWPKSGGAGRRPK
jgi:hypothetical protein